MSHDHMLALFAGVATMVFLVVIVAVRHPVRRWLFAGTGLQEWQVVADGLSWRDRWALHMGTSRGRVVSPRLSALAVQRGEMTAAVIERMSIRSSRFRKLSRALGVLGLVELAIDLVSLATGDRGAHVWVGLFSAVVLVMIGFFGWPLQRRQARLVQRSIRRNRPSPPEDDVS